MTTKLPPPRKPGDVFKCEAAWLQPKPVGRIVFARLTRRGQGRGKPALWLVWSRAHGEERFTNEAIARARYEEVSAQ